MSSLPCQIFISSLCTSHDCTVPAVLGEFCTVFLKCPLIQLTRLQTTFRALCLHSDQPLVLRCSWVPEKVGVSKKLYSHQKLGVSVIKHRQPMGVKLKMREGNLRSVNW